MDPRQFDALSRAVADGVSRRRVLARLGAGGLAAGFAAAIGRGRTGAALPTAQADTCRLEIVANVRLGPSAGALLDGDVPGELRGELSFALGADGTIDRGRWRLEGGAELPVVGHATGRAINLRARAGDGQVVVLVGTAEEGLDRCTGAVDGLLTGPEVGDLGDWHATATALGERGTTGRAAPAVAAVPTRSAGSRGTPAAANATETATATGTVAATETATTTPTGTATATATTAPTETATPEPTATPTPTPEPEILCAAPLVECGGVCVDPQVDTGNCGACGNACALGQVCTDGVCQFLQACLSPQVFCGGVCVDLSSDPNNCGSCGNVCAVIEVCQGGECGGAVLDPGDPFTCAAGLVDCGGACVDVLTDAANCGACGNACAADETCFGGACARDQRG